MDLRPELEPLPARLKQLPVHRGFPVPWFVAWDDKGVPEFRCADAEKWRRAINEKLCWVCGEKLGRFMAFVAGPMCGINRTSAEPPCHLECAQWSARNCPFLSKPQMVRREGGIPDGAFSAGHAIMRNPGVTLIWVVKRYDLFGDGKGGVLIDMGRPERVEWYHCGKPATRNQVVDAVRTGLPALEAIAITQEGAMVELSNRLAELALLYPKQ